MSCQLTKESSHDQSIPLRDACGPRFIALIFIMAGSLARLCIQPPALAIWRPSMSQPFCFWPAAIFELVAGIFILIGFQTRITALLLAGFSVLSALIFHTDFGDQTQTIMFLKNLGLAGGMLFLVCPRRGQPISSITAIANLSNLWKGIIPCHCAPLPHHFPQPTMEGAGVHLHRGFGFGEPSEHDPFLLFDDFRNDNPREYEAGFPWHPHRGIETITYVLAGTVAHADSLGNEGDLNAGDVQWMTAGSGILHQEMPRGNIAGQMHGFQLVGQSAL